MVCNENDHRVIRMIAYSNFQCRRYTVVLTKSVGMIKIACCDMTLLTFDGNSVFVIFFVVGGAITIFTKEKS